MDTETATDTETRAYELIQRANALHSQGRPVPAIPLYKEAAEIYPPYASFHLVAGDLLAGLGQYADAAEAYGALLVTHPGHEQAKASIAEMHRKMNGGAAPGFLSRLLHR